MVNHLVCLDLVKYIAHSVYKDLWMLLPMASKTDSGQVRPGIRSKAAQRNDVMYMQFGAPWLPDTNGALPMVSDANGSSKR